MTSRTPGRLSKTGASEVPLLPVTPIAVRWPPGIGCARKPRASTAATTPWICCGVASCRMTTSMSGLPSQPALANAVGEIDDETRGQPEEEAPPRERGKVGHERQAHQDPEDRRDRHERNAKLARPLRLAGAQDQDADAHEDEGEEGADIGELDDLVD